MKKIIICFAASLFCLCAVGNSFESEGIRYLLNDDMNSCMVTYPQAGVYAGDIVIPSSVIYEGFSYTVSGIGEYAFAGSAQLTSVVIPSGVWTVGRNAFQGCASIVDITLPDHVSELEEQTFYGCTSLVAFHGKGVGSVGGAAFGNCPELSMVEFGKDVSYFGDSAFKNCRSLKSMVIPAGAVFGTSAFSGCTGLESITLPYDLEVLPAHIFNGCTSLKEAKGSERLVEVADYAFYTCGSLENFYFPSTIEHVGENAFGFCTSLREASVKSQGGGLIGNYAFSGCSALEMFECEGITEIGEEAVAANPALTLVKLNPGVFYIRARAFRDCGNLTTVLCHEYTPPIMENSAFDDKTYRTAVLGVPSNKIDLYSRTLPWSFFRTVTDVQIAGVPETAADEEKEIDVCIRGSELIVSGVVGRLYVYNAAGMKVAEMEKGYEDVSLPLPGSGVYVVKIGEYVKKIAVR